MQLRVAYERAKQFILRDLWSLELADMGRWRKTAVRWLRTLSLAAHGFVVDKCPLRAAALSLVFLFSLAPTLAVGFSVAKGFGAQQMIKEKLPEWVSLAMQSTEDNAAAKGVEKTLTGILNYVDQTNVRALGGLGVLIALYAAYKLLSAIEKTMNDIWGVRRRRHPMRKIVDYAAVLFVFPILLILAVLVVASFRIESVASGFQSSGNPLLRLVGAILGSGFVTLSVGKLLPLIIAAAAFWFLYFFFPNTRVPPFSAFVGGVAAAIMLAVLQWLFVMLQVGVSRASAVYGTFAALPIFILWMHFSWLVVLFGAELCYAHANKKDLLFGGISFAPSAAYEEQLALGVMTLVARAFTDGRPPLTCEFMSHRLGAPVRVTRRIITTLIRAGLLSELQGDTPAFQPAVPVERITFGRVTDAVRSAGDHSRQTVEFLDRLGVNAALKQRDASQTAIADTPLLDLVRRPPDEIESPEEEA